MSINYLSNYYLWSDKKYFKKYSIYIYIFGDRFSFKLSVSKAIIYIQKSHIFVSGRVNINQVLLKLWPLTLSPMFKMGDTEELGWLEAKGDISMTTYSDLS